MHKDASTNKSMAVRSKRESDTKWRWRGNDNLNVESYVSAELLVARAMTTSGLMKNSRVVNARLFGEDGNDTLFGGDNDVLKAMTTTANIRIGWNQEQQGATDGKKTIESICT